MLLWDLYSVLLLLCIFTGPMITNYTIATNFFAVEMSTTLYLFPCFRLGFLTAPGSVKEESGVACRYRVQLSFKLLGRNVQAVYVAVRKREPE